MTNIFLDGLIDSAFVLVPLAIALGWMTWAIAGAIKARRQPRPIDPQPAHRSHP